MLSGMQAYIIIDKFTFYLAYTLLTISIIDIIVSMPNNIGKKPLNKETKIHI